MTGRIKNTTNTSAVNLSVINPEKKMSLQLATS